MIKNMSFDRLAGTTLGNYRLERSIGQSKIGPAFLASTNATTSCLLRFLKGPMYTDPGEQEVYLEHFQYRASQVATLQHPHILPLLGFGVYRGFPYLVSPHIPLRSLRTRIDKNGPLNTLIVGRYLDQVATALEYAHEHAVLHNGLSVDCIFIRLDGQLVVADVGVRSLLELDGQAMSRHQLLERSDGYAPEQLLGKSTSPATDVYALGMVVYHLLTGSAVYEGSTLDEIVQQHLYSPIPSLPYWRSDLPAGLHDILTRALAKDPSQRFHQPGAFANAYHNHVSPSYNGTRLPFVVSEAPSVPANQPSVIGAPMAGTEFTEPAWSDGRSAATDHTSGSPRSAFQSPNTHSLHGFANDEPLSPNSSPRPDLMRRFGRKKKRSTIVIASLAALLVFVGSWIGIALLTQKSNAVTSAGSQAMFFTNQGGTGGQTNSLRINIQHLAPPPSGSDYQAWIVNDQTEQVIDLGRLIEKNQTWSLTFSAASSNLLAAGDKLEITQEQGVVNAPAGTVILAGTFPVLSFQHVQHLLVGYPATPGKAGLLVGLLGQTHLLDTQAAVLQNVSASRNTVVIGCIAQSIVDIIEGAHGAHYQPLARTCTQQNVNMGGDGFGLLGKGYLDGAEEHASLALSQKDATRAMHQHATLMDIAITNISGWVTTIDQDALHLRAHPSNLSTIQEMATLSDDAYHGVDTNGDGQIDPVAGEAGAITAYQQGQLMATLFLVPNV